MPQSAATARQIKPIATAIRTNCQNSQKITHLGKYADGTPAVSPRSRCAEQSDRARVPAVYLTHAFLAFLSVRALRGMNNLRGCNVLDIPTPPRLHHISHQYILLIMSVGLGSWLKSLCDFKSKPSTAKALWILRQLRHG